MKVLLRVKKAPRYYILKSQLSLFSGDTHPEKVTVHGKHKTYIATRHKKTKTTNSKSATIVTHESLTNLAGDRVDTVTSRATGRETRSESRAEMITKAKNELQELGVKNVELPDNPSLANYAVEALKELRNRGFYPPEKISRTKVKGMVVAQALHDNTLLLGDDRFPDGIFKEQVAAKWLSQENPVLHEMGHIYHYSLQEPAFQAALKRRKYIQDNSKPDKTPEEYNEYFRLLSDSDLDFSKWRRQKGERKVAGKVSGYARRNPKEFIAEAFAGMISGKEYDGDVMNLYERYGGPEVPRITE